MMNAKLIPLTGLALLCALSGCSDKDNNQGDSAGNTLGSGTSPVETFDFPGKKSDGQLGGTGTTTSTGTDTTSTPSQGEAGQPSTTSSMSTSSTTTSVESSSSSTPSSSGESSMDTGNDPGAVDSGYLEGKGEALSGEQPKFKDLGSFWLAIRDDGSYRETSRHTNTREEHQSLFLGNERIYFPGPGSLGVGNIIRRSYFIFDVSAVQNAKSAELQFWVWNKSSIFNNYGVYSSEHDPYEEVSLYSLDQVTPAEILAAPFGDKDDHSFDAKAGMDLGQGTKYATFRMTPKIYESGMTPNSNVVGDDLKNCAESKNACGKWIRIPLNEKAVAQINASSGLFGMGVSLDSVDHNKERSGMKFGLKDKEFRLQEWMFNGVPLDLSENVGTELYPSLVPQPPTLRVKY